MTSWLPIAVLLLTFGACERDEPRASRVAPGPHADPFEIRLDTPEDEVVDETWYRIVPPPAADLHGVDATHFRGRPEWQLGVNVMEFVRDVPLERELREQIPAALRAVPGVTSVREEDREVWVVEGTPSGRALVVAVGGVVDRYAARNRACMDVAAGRVTSTTACQ